MPCRTSSPQTTVVLVGADGDPEVTGAELGATLDARALADRAFGEHPMWNVTTWFADPNSAAVRIDADAATAALREAAPELFVDPVDATIAFDAATASYVATPDVPGTGVDVESVRLALQSALAEGTTRVEVDATPVEIPAVTSTVTADESAASLNSDARHRRLLRGRRAHRARRPRGRGILALGRARPATARSRSPQTPRRSSRSSTASPRWSTAPPRTAG